MPAAKTVPAFTDNQRNTAHSLLAAKVARMMGRKLEEGDWAEVYCRAKELPPTTWSNVDMDIRYGGLGIEQKMLRRSSRKDIDEACGTWLMHPSATRAFNLPEADSTPKDAMRFVLEQYANLINKRRTELKANSPDGSVDLRSGWLLWQERLRQFLYFEEPLVAPNPKDFYADWKKHERTGSRRSTRNLWIYDRKTKQKRFSVTTEAGAKIQPYFQVPPSNDPNLYIFTVIGEVIMDGMVRCWLTRTTWHDLENLLGTVNSQTISKAIQEHLAELPAAEAGPVVQEPAQPLDIAAETYALLTSRLPGVNDDHCFQLLIRLLRRR